MGCVFDWGISWTSSYMYVYYQSFYNSIPKFSDRQVWESSVGPDQISSLIRVYTVCHSVCIFWTHYSMVEPLCSNFRVITANFLGVRIFKIFTVPDSSCSSHQWPHRGRQRKQQDWRSRRKSFWKNKMCRIIYIPYTSLEMYKCWLVVLRLNVPVNNFSFRGYTFLIHPLKCINVSADSSIDVTSECSQGISGKCKLSCCF